jgi:threonine dehydrogenase-like Zn-dependent dehydrogenase
MKALTWQGTHDVRVENVPDPAIEQPTDIIIKVTSTGICGSDLHLYEVLGAFIDPGDVLGHEPMGIVQEAGPEVTHVKPGDRVVIPFNVSCGHCFMCEAGLQSQCETTQVHEYGTGASLLGYTKLYGQVPGGQAEYLRVPQGHYGPIKVPEGSPDDRFVYLSDVLPTAWQAVKYANVPDDGAVLVLGLGPIGEMATRVAQYQFTGGGRRGRRGSSCSTDRGGARVRPPTLWAADTSQRAVSRVSRRVIGSSGSSSCRGARRRASRGGRL